ncbi:portal protein [Candidatus Magnetobacterium bavaricum]|uniref:Portal protein n=1 Tax=Candidatus Magnetobacterium bavaricum TaxID=29290 RepID=A0A0F3GUY7_9BACT|nr:portal protein [Candidatus Magnetobacterium bavaricum]
MNTAITKMILGQTLTSSQGTIGSQALGKVHGSIRDEYIKSDADLISECFNQTIIPWMVDYNWPGITAYPKFYIETEMKDDQQAKITRDIALALQIGLPMSNKYFYDTYEITPPRDGEELIYPQKMMLEQQQQPDNGQQQLEQQQQQTYSEPVTFSGQEVLDKYIKGLSPKELQMQMNDVLNPVIDAVKNSETYTEIQEKLKKIYPKMDTLKFEGIIKTAMTTADLVGRTNAG